MSTSPKSLDLRDKVIKYLESGHTQVSAARIFNLNISAVKQWHKREGYCNPKPRLGSKGKIDLEKLEQYILLNSDAKLKGAAKEFGVSIPAISYRLKELGFSYKKTFTYLEANKDRRGEYLEEAIKYIDYHNLVYIDESGIDMTICKDRGWGKNSEKLFGKKSGKYYERSNIVASYVNKKSITPMVLYQIP